MPLRSAAVLCPTFLLILILKHSPRFEPTTSRNQGNQRQSFSLTSCDEHGVSCPTHQSGRCIQTYVRNEARLLCSNIQMCTHAGQVCIRCESYSPTFPVSRQYRRSSGCQWCSVCPECHLLRLPCCEGLGSDSLQPLDHEFLLSRRSTRGRRVKLLSQQLCNNRISHRTVAAPLPCLSVRCGRKGCNCMCVMALLWLDEV